MANNSRRETIKARLGKYRMLCEECDYMRKRIESNRREMDWIKEVLTKIPAGIGTDAIRQAEIAMELIDGMISYYSKLTAQREAEERRVLDMLSGLKHETGSKILYLHFIEGHSFNDIPDELYIADRTMWYKYKAAIDELCALDNEAN